MPTYFGALVVESRLTDCVTINLNEQIKNLLKREPAIEDFAVSDNQEIPAPPKRPDANECCGGGCVPCVYDYYYDRLERWEKEHGESYRAKKKADKGDH